MWSNLLLPLVKTSLKRFMHTGSSRLFSNCPRYYGRVEYQNHRWAQKRFLFKTRHASKNPSCVPTWRLSSLDHTTNNSLIISLNILMVETVKSPQYLLMIMIQNSRAALAYKHCKNPASDAIQMILVKESRWSFKNGFFANVLKFMEILVGSCPFCETA